MAELIEGGRLSLWGIALVLCWTASLRLVNMAHVALAARKWVRPPAHPMQPMEPAPGLLLTCVALASGNATLIAFAGTAIDSLDLPPWIAPLAIDPWLQLVRILCAGAVLVFFLTRVAEHPRWKVVWSAAWCVFALAITRWA
jgi:hypothetical protein